MEVYRRSSWLLLLLGVTFLAAALQGVQGEAEPEGPSESECRPYIEKALKELATEDTVEHPETPGGQDSAEDVPTVEITTDDSDHLDGDGDGDDDSHDDGKDSAESIEHGVDNETVTDESDEEPDKSKEAESAENAEQTEGETSREDDTKSDEGSLEQVQNVEENNAIPEDTTSNESEDRSAEDNIESAEGDTKSDENIDGDAKSDKDDDKSTDEDTKSAEDDPKSAEDDAKSAENDSAEDDAKSAEDGAKSAEDSTKSAEDDTKSAEDDDTKSAEDDTKSAEDDAKSVEDDTKSAEDDAKSTESDDTKSTDDTTNSAEEVDEKSDEDAKSADDDAKSAEGDTKSTEDKTGSDENETRSGDDDANNAQDETKSVENETESEEEGNNKTEEASNEKQPEDDTEDSENSTQQAKTEGLDQTNAEGELSKEDKTKSEEDAEDSAENSQSDEPVPEEELTKEIDIPTELRPRDHIEHLLKLDEESSEKEKVINRVADITLKELKRLYENAIKPLEVLYKYRDLSNRHFGDPEIFAKPLVLFMGPWSGGKSSIINYLLDNEYNDTSLRTGAEPSPAYFNILMHGEEPEVLEGTQLAADYTFSGLQKFGQGLEERLRGLKLPRKLLEKINLVEIPGILEVRKQVSRLFPFNDACQWFIDRADIIFLVYDPSKLDVGPETEAILDQLKGREHQTRIILNKADQVKPEELMRVQGALIWNISPLMSSAQPPVMYTTSLWSRPYEVWAPVRLLQAQERAFLRDLRSAIDKRIENKIASARRFAVRVRNHAKMVDCYLTTYYNHKSVFGNKKHVADEITEHPQDYHIYEGISTLTNISRYDLPDPDVYRDFFKLNALYDFQQLSATCTYFRGCPINRLDVAIAYDLPELVGKHRRLVENALAEANLSQTPDS